jgi:hypothetical protein
MAKAGTDEACVAPPDDSLATSVETCPRCRWRRAVGFEPGLGPTRHDESRSGRSGERRFAAGGGAHGRRAGRPAGRSATGRPVRRQPARRPGTSGRAAAPTLAPAGTAMDHAHTARRRERNPNGRATEGRSAREVGDGGFRSGGARIQHRPLGDPLGRGQPHPSRGHRSVIWPNTLPERGRAVASRFASARPLSAASKGVERGGGVAVPPLSRSSRRRPR